MQTGIIIVVGGVGIRCHHIILVFCTILRLHNIRIARVAGALRSICHRHAAVQGLVIIAVLRYGVKMFSPLVDLASFLKYANKYAPLVLLGKLLLSSAAEADRPAKGRLVANISTDRNKDNSRLDTFSHRIYLHKSLSLPSGIKSAHCLLTTQHRRQILPAAYGYTYPHSFTE